MNDGTIVKFSKAEIYVSTGSNLIIREYAWQQGNLGYIQRNQIVFKDGVNFFKNLPNVVLDATRFQPNIWPSILSNLTTAVWLNLKQPIHILT